MMQNLEEEKKQKDSKIEKSLFSRSKLTALIESNLGNLNQVVDSPNTSITDDSQSDELTNGNQYHVSHNSLTYRWSLINLT